MKSIKSDTQSNVLNTTIDVLNQITSNNFANLNQQQLNDFKVFYTKTSSKVTIDFFVRRIQRHFELCDNGLIVMMIYLNKVSGSVPITQGNALKLILGAAVAAVKYCHDEIYDNCVYAKIGGVSTAELNLIETVFLKLIDYELYISEELYQAYDSVYLQ